uniref:RxLR effector candidate protein n=1 Tax=Hyaloperonospora arabidopsidis (strain Emoy2) TaxID=559515 RepID=M4C166_HYAAE
MRLIGEFAPLSCWLCAFFVCLQCMHFTHVRRRRPVSSMPESVLRAMRSIVLYDICPRRWWKWLSDLTCTSTAGSIATSSVSSTAMITSAAPFARRAVAVTTKSTLFFVGTSNATAPLLLRTNDRAPLLYESLKLYCSSFPNDMMLQNSCGAKKTSVSVTTRSTPSAITRSRTLSTCMSSSASPFALAIS